MKVGGFDSLGVSHFNAYHLMIAGLPYMVDQARAAAQTQAFSYRRFKVGAAAFAVKSGIETAIFNGGNVKPNPNKPKVCAERVVVGQAQKLGFDTILGLVVVATTNIDEIEEVTGARTPTLHPCGECRGDHYGKVAGNSLISGDTLIITAGIEQDILQAHTLQELQTAYANGDTLTESRSGFEWELTTATFGHLYNQSMHQDPGLRHDQTIQAALAKELFLQLETKV